MADLSDRVESEGFVPTINPNLIINGGMDFWQRGTGFAAINQYTADRWKTDETSAYFVVQNESVPNDSAPWSLFNAAGVGFIPTMYTSVELTNPAIGPAPFTPNKDYTLSFWAKRLNIDPFQITISFVDVVNSLTNRVVILDTVTEPASIADTWQYFTVTFNIGAAVPVASNLALEINFKAINTVAQDETSMFLALVKLEEGSRATTFTRSGNTLAGELENCQRYFQNTFMGVGLYSTNGEDAICSGAFPVAMRAAPTVNILAGAPNIQITQIGAGNLNADAVNFSVISPDFANARIGFSIDGVGTFSANAAVTAEFNALALEAEL
jgi:hypothetical protein